MKASTKAKVDLFRVYLENLPNTIPYIESGGETSKYSFDFFSLMTMIYRTRVLLVLSTVNLRYI